MSTPPKTTRPANGKRPPVLRPAGCLHAQCPDVAAAGDVSALLGQVLERVEALEGLPAQVSALAATIEGVKDGVNLLVAAHELSVRQRSTGGEGHA